MKLQRVEKPWGYEVIFAHTEWYAGKILCIRSRRRLSLQHHCAKDETLFLLDGEVELELEVGGGQSLSRRMGSDQSYRVRPGQIHRLAALTDARVLEVSTPELDDVVRWEDDYGRDPVRPDQQEWQGRFAHRQEPQVCVRGCMRRVDQEPKEAPSG